MVGPSTIYFDMNKIENLLGPPNGCFSVSESMRVTYLLTGLILEVLADLKTSYFHVSIGYSRW